MVAHWSELAGVNGGTAVRLGGALTIFDHDKLG
jgi:hypothetical protein